MKIGEFAEYCGTKISVLRHYDRVRLLVPERIDIFTGYRYYSPTQRAIYDRINALKKAGFTLHEIKKIVSFSVTEGEIDEMFARKADELKQTKKFLKEAEKIMKKLNVTFEGGTARVKAGHPSDKVALCEKLDSYIKNADYQRVSQFDMSDDEISCSVIRLGDEAVGNDPVLPFENDSRVIGKWEIIGNFAVIEDFPCEKDDIDNLYFKELEFFADGKCRCVYEDETFAGFDKVCWTKDYVLRKWNWSACRYEIRTINSVEYLITEWKSGDYRFGGFDTNYYVFTRA